MFGSPETQPGGRALKFYASQRLDIRRIETLKDGTEAVGNRVRVKVVKNKVAAPFRQAEFDIEFGKGISTAGCILDLGIEHSIITKSGSFFSYGDERLGQGRDNAKGYLDGHPEVAKEIEGKIYECSASARTWWSRSRATRWPPRPWWAPPRRRAAPTARSRPAASRPPGRARRGARRPGSAAGLRGRGAPPEAFDIAWRFLAHRDRTEAEVRRNFTRKRMDPAFVEEVVAALLEGSYLDDAAFARRFAEDRRNLDPLGRRAHRAAAEGAGRRPGRDPRRPGERWRRGRSAGHDELEAACELLARRFPHPPETPRDLERALGFLVRKGYELELAHDALRRHAQAMTSRG